MEQCNFQAVELTHISLCGTNLPVMNLSGHCGASTTSLLFGSSTGGGSVAGLLIFQHTHLPDMKTRYLVFDGRK